MKICAGGAVCLCRILETTGRAPINPIKTNYQHVYLAFRGAQRRIIRGLMDANTPNFRPPTCPSNNYYPDDQNSSWILRLQLIHGGARVRVYITMAFCEDPKNSFLGHIRRKVVPVNDRVHARRLEPFAASIL